MRQQPPLCILLFDDKDQTAIIESVKNQLIADFELDFVFIRTSAPKLKKDDSEDLDADKLKNEIETKIAGKSITLALTDFDLESPDITGLNVIEMVHDFRPKVKFFVYSGNWTKVIRSVLGPNYKEAQAEELVAEISKLIHNNIINCIERADYKESLTTYLRGEYLAYKNNNRLMQDSIKDSLLSLLRANGSIPFQSCFPEFKGKTFNEIADLIEHSDDRSKEWIEAVLSQTIAYLIKINR